MINMDMIGRLKDNKLTVGGVGTAPEWRGWLAHANPPVAITAVMRPRATVDDPSTTRESSADFLKELNLTLNEDGFGPSDHSSFYGKKIPVLFFFTGSHEDYHKPSDTADKINYEGEARIVAWSVAGSGSRQERQAPDLCSCQERFDGTCFWLPRLSRNYSELRRSK